MEKKKEAVKRLRATAPRFNRRKPSQADKSRVPTPVGLTYDEAGTVMRELGSQFKSIKAG